MIRLVSAGKYLDTLMGVRDSTDFWPIAIKIWERERDLKRCESCKGSHWGDFIVSSTPFRHERIFLGSLPWDTNQQDTRYPWFLCSQSYLYTLLLLCAVLTFCCHQNTYFAHAAPGVILQPLKEVAISKRNLPWITLHVYSCVTLKYKAD